MTTEYEPGTEDIYIGVTADTDAGVVRVGVYHTRTDQRLYGFAFPATVARSMAEKLTLASFRVEDDGGH